MVAKQKQQTGFTIVELLIVVVVIAILAAITIVAYNGIQNRAKASAAQSAASQVSKRIQTFAIENAESYPASLSALGISNNGATTYQYAVDNNASPKYYCVTATTQNLSYYISSTSPRPTSGGCPGHGQNGAPSITNLATNPSFEAGNAGIGFNTNGSSGSNSIETTGGHSGSNFFRRAFNAASTGNVVGPYQQVTGLSGDKTYFLRAAVRSNTPVSYRIIAERRDASGQNLGSYGGATVNVPGNSTWTELQLEVPPTANMERITFCIYSSSSNFSNGMIVDYDSFFIAEGAGPYTYADGSTTNWIWNGTTHASTSTGPAV